VATAMKAVAPALGAALVAAATLSFRTTAPWCRVPTSTSRPRCTWCARSATTSATGRCCSIAGGSSAVSIGTVVAFTTLQTRLLFPIGSLLNVGIDIQTSRALFDRIFEYLDQPVDIQERAEPREVTAGFAGTAAILLLLGGGMSLRWFRRLL